MTEICEWDRFSIGWQERLEKCVILLEKARITPDPTSSPPLDNPLQKFCKVPFRNLSPIYDFFSHPHARNVWSFFKQFLSYPLVHHHHHPNTSILSDSFIFLTKSHAVTKIQHGSVTEKNTSLVPLVVFYKCLFRYV